MSLHPLATEFAGLADVYERGRPEYPGAVVERLCAELGLQPGARVLDLAAGTGKLTRALVAGGLEVSAVEPLGPLRDVLVATVGAGRVHEGVAEAIPFADGTFAAVTVADAFHWFDQGPALAEIRRVLRPGGGLALISSMPELSPELVALINDARTAHPYFDGPSAQETLAAAPGWGEARCVSIAARQRLAILDYVRSMSWVAAMDEPARGALLSSVRAVAGEQVELPVHAVMWLSARD